MRKCPKCNQTFTDNNSFCLMDGTNLINADTVENKNYSADTPTVFLSNVRTPDNTNIIQKSTPNWLYPVLGLFVGLTFIFGFLAFFAQYNTSPNKSETKNSNEKHKVEKTSKTENDLDGKQRIELSESEVRNLINTWKSAQDSKNFAIYQSCYSQDFQGIKRTKSGSKRTLGFNRWINDRRRMIAKARTLNIEIKNLKINVSAAIATAQFDQYYRSQNYSDWGPKILKIKLTSDNTAKIIYEELKASYPLN